MYGLYKIETKDSEPKLIAVCHTKIGAKRSCKHFAFIYHKETGKHFYRIEYRPIDSYWQLRVGYFGLCRLRAYETRKLRRLEYEEQEASRLRAAQERKLASLY